MDAEKRFLQKWLEIVTWFLSKKHLHKGISKNSYSVDLSKIKNTLLIKNTLFTL